MGTVTPYARQRAQAKAPKMGKVWETKDTAIASTLVMDQGAMMMRAPSPIVPGKVTIYQNLQWDNPPGRVNYVTPLGGEELLSFRWNHVILMQSAPVGCIPLKKWEKVGS